MELLSQHPQLSGDKETEGFDISSGKIWIYPDNYPIREYQFSMVQTALYNNTLVCLPTGLGKTFIAAVVMYNFWRWYPKGKVIFLAPTKPLVMQQVDACHNVMGIPSQEIELLLGTSNAKKREAAWSAKETRVIFATPQVFHNDLKNNTAPADLIKCVVVDEGHRALGKHSYTECIRILSEKNKYFRVLALSATPGNKINDVHAVVRNLHVASLEIRDEDSPDIVPYTNEKQVKVVVVELGSVLEKYKERYIAVMDRHVKVLARCNVLQGDTANISKGRIYYLLKESRNNRSGNHGQITKTLTILMTMYHAYELLVRNGLRSFLQFYQTHSDKFWMSAENQLRDLLDEIKDYLGPFPEFISPLAKEQDIPRNITFGHKKFLKLKEILESHFASDCPEAKNSRAIVFVECRSTVNEVYILLLQLRPLIRAQMFVGQSGLKQKQQIQMIENFRSNHINVLISTSIGEEGLDVGEVDLIICFDIVHVSPTRLVQRMGRTGRKRDGQVIILVTNGREHEALQSTLRRRSSISNKILNTSGIFSSLYQENPRMIPAQFTPTCYKMFISPDVAQKPSEKSKKKGTTGKAKSKAQNSIKGSLTGDSKLRKSKGQSSIAKFFVNKARDSIDLSPVSPTSSVATEPTGMFKTTVDPSEIKLLTSDDDAADFLTLCTLKVSSEDVQDKTDSFLAKYTDIATTRNNNFDFDVPDPSILDSLDYMMDHLPEVTVKFDDDNKIEECNNEWDTGSFFDDVDFSNLNNSFSNYVTHTDFESTDLNSDILSPNTSEYNHEKEENLSREMQSSSPIVKANTCTDNWQERSKLWDAAPSMFETLLNESSDSSNDDMVMSSQNQDINKSVNTVSNNANTSYNNQMNQKEIENKEKSKVKVEDDYIIEDCIILDDDTSNSNTSCDIQKKEVFQNDISGKEMDKSVARCKESFEKNYFGDDKATNSNDTLEAYFNSPEVKATKLNDIFPSSSIRRTLPDANATRSNQTGDSSVWDITRAVNEIACINTEHEKQTTHKITRLSVEPPKAPTYFDSDDDLFAELDYEDVIDEQECAIADKSSPIKEQNESIEQKERFIKESADKALQDSMLDSNLKDLNEIVDEFDSDFASDWIDVAAKPTPKVDVKSNSSNTSVAQSSTRKSLNFSNISQKENTKGKGARLSLAQKLSGVKKTQENSLIEQPDEEIDSSDGDLIFNDIITGDIDGLENNSPFFTASTSFSRNAKDSPTATIRKTMQLQSDGKSESDLGDDSPFKVPGKYVNGQQKRITAKTTISGRKEIAVKDKKSSANKENNGGTTWSRKARRRRANDFICDEAEVSSDGQNTSDETSDGDDDLADFVSYTQNVQDDSNVYAHYVQSIRSPHNKRHGFVFKKLRSPEPDIQIYSQPASQVDDTYLYDSFCVREDEDEEEEEDESIEQEHSVLMEAERVLANRQRKRSRNKSTTSTSRKKKRRRIVEVLSTSSEDETEHIRGQILNESLLQKRL